MKTLEKPIRTEDELDLMQYMTNILYNAYADGKSKVKSSTFDTWVEEQTGLIIEYLTKFKQAELQPKEFDTHQCNQCGGRTALVTGQFYYDPDSEPYNNGIEEDALVGSGECWAGGYKCDDCGHIQGMWHE